MVPILKCEPRRSQRQPPPAAKGSKGSAALRGVSAAFRVSPRSGRKNVAHGVRSCENIETGHSSRTIIQQLTLWKTAQQSIFSQLREPWVREPSLTPVPSPARAGEGCRRRSEGSLPQGWCPGLRSCAPDGAVEGSALRTIWSTNLRDTTL
jgi:hypothetical protein